MSTEEDPVTQPEPTAHATGDRSAVLMAEMIVLIEQRYKQDRARDAAAGRERARQRAAEREPVSDQEPAE